MTRVGFIEDLKLMFWLGIPLRIVRINTMSGGDDHMQTLNGYPNGQESTEPRIRPSIKRAVGGCFEDGEVDRSNDSDCKSVQVVV